MTTRRRKRHNPEQIVRKLCEAATPGPWRPDARVMLNQHYSAGCGPWSISKHPEPPHERALSMCEPSEQSIIDAQFIAAARTALPELLDQIDKLEECDATVADIASAAIYLADSLQQSTMSGNTKFYFVELDKALLRREKLCGVGK